MLSFPPGSRGQQGGLPIKQEEQAGRTAPAAEEPGAPAAREKAKARPGRAALRRRASVGVAAACAVITFGVAAWLLWSNTVPLSGQEIRVFALREQDAQTVGETLEALGGSVTEETVSAGDAAQRLQEARAAGEPAVLVAGELPEGASTAGCEALDPSNWRETLYCANLSEDECGKILEELETRTAATHVERVNCELRLFDNTVYHGSYSGYRVNGEPQGYGRFEEAEGEFFYAGSWENGKASGYGVVEKETGERYEGGFLNGLREGEGVFTWANGDCYEGSFSEDLFSGKGVYTWADGSRYTGDFLEGKFEGQGVQEWADGKRYEGGFSNDRREGYGVYTWTNGDVYEGEFHNGNPDGQGVMTYADGTVQSGAWENGRFLGEDAPAAEENP